MPELNGLNRYDLYRTVRRSVLRFGAQGAVRNAGRERNEVSRVLAELDALERRLAATAPHEHAGRATADRAS